MERPGALGIFMVKKKVARTVTVNGEDKNTDSSWFTYLVDFKVNKGLRLEYCDDGAMTVLEDVKKLPKHPLDAAELISKGLYMTEIHDDMTPNVFKGMKLFDEIEDENGIRQKVLGAEVGFPTFRPLKSVPKSEITWTHVKSTCAAVDFVLMQIALLYRRRVQEAGGLVPGEVPAISTLRWVLTADVEDKLLPHQDYLREEAAHWHRQLLYLHHFAKNIADADSPGEKSDDFYTRDAARVAWLLHQDRLWDKYDGLRDWRRDDYPHHLHPNCRFEGHDLLLPENPPLIRSGDETLTLEKAAPVGEDQSVHRLAVLLRRLNTDAALNEQFFIYMHEGGPIWDTTKGEDVGQNLEVPEIGDLAQFFGVLNMCQSSAATPMAVDAADVSSAGEEMDED